MAGEGRGRLEEGDFTHTSGAPLSAAAPPVRGKTLQSKGPRGGDTTTATFQRGQSGTKAKCTTHCGKMGLAGAAGPRAAGEEGGPRVNGMEAGGFI